MTEKLNVETLDDLAEELETIAKIGETRSGDLDWLQKRFYRTHPLTGGNLLTVSDVAVWLRQRAFEERKAVSS